MTSKQALFQRSSSPSWLVFLRCGLFLAWVSGLCFQPFVAWAAEGSYARQVVLSGVYFHGFLQGRPEPEESIRLTNLDQTRAADVSGWVLSDRFHKRPPRRRSQRRGTRRGSNRKGRSRKQRVQAYIAPIGRRRDIILPQGTSIPPGGSIWIAYQAEGFQRMFGFPPHVQGESDAPNILKASLPSGWPNLPSTTGVVSLHNASGQLVDLVAYVTGSQKDTLDTSVIPKEHWSGAPVNMRSANPYSSRGQILARDRDERGVPIPDTNTSADWDNSFSAKKLGVDYTHRVEKPGQTLFTPQRHRQVDVEILATSAPENNTDALKQAFARAKSEILLNIYIFTSLKIAETMIKAVRRGVKVTVLLEGVPVGGVPKKARYVAHRLHSAGVKILWMRGDRKQKMIKRYRFNHAKYAIIDRTWVVIGTENYGGTGHPNSPEYGNRGWEIQIRSPVLVRELLAVWKEDTAYKRHLDLLPFSEAGGTRWDAPPSGFKPTPRSYPPLYSYRKPPLRVQGKADLELVLSPDNSLHERQSIIGSILRCKEEVLIQQNSIPLYWGQKKQRSFLDTQNLPLQAVIKAARKGCRVRVLIDSTWYNIDTRDERKNDKTVAMLNQIAQRERLDLRARLINLHAAGVAKIHAKGVMVDRKEVYIGSINWTENSFKGNREVGVIIRHPQVAGYYVDLFLRDWLRSRIFQVALRTDIPVYASPSVRADVVARFVAGDTLDVLAELPSFYQVRIAPRKLGFILKGDHEIYFTPYEARFFSGREGVVVGKVKTIQERPKMFQIFFSKPVERDLVVVLWKNKLSEFQKAYPNRPLKELLAGRRVQFQGTISQFKGSTQLTLNSPQQIRFLE